MMMMSPRLQLLQGQLNNVTTHNDRCTAGRQLMPVSVAGGPSHRELGDLRSTGHWADVTPRAEEGSNKMNACTNMWNCVQEGILEDLLPHMDESIVQNIVNWLQTQHSVVALSCLAHRLVYTGGSPPSTVPFCGMGRDGAVAT